MGGQTGGGEGRVHVVREGALTPPPPAPLISVTRCLVCSHTVVVAAARVVAVAAVARYTSDLELLLEHLCRYHHHQQSIVIITLQLKPCNQPHTVSPSQIAPPQDTGDILVAGPVPGPHCQDG